MYMNPLRHFFCSCLFTILLAFRKMARMIQWFYLLIMIPCAVCEQTSLTITTNEVISTLTRALHFFSLNTDQVNLDAGIGTRIAADQLRFHTKFKQGQLIQRLVDLSEHVTWQIARSVRYRQPHNYEQLSFLLSPGIFSTLQPFQFHRNKYHVNTKINCSSSVFIEKYSDRCLHSLAVSNCDDTKACIILMMNEPYTCRYLLTHQVLYSIIAKKFSCYHYHRQHHYLSIVDEYVILFRNLIQSDKAVAFLYAIKQNST